MKKALRILLTLAIVFCAVALPFADAMTVSAATTVAAPKADKASGNYVCDGTISVTLTCKTKGADIYYSIGKGYKKYDEPITLSKSATLKCYAKKKKVKSETAKYEYKLQASIIIDKAGGRYDEPQTVSISTPVPGATLYYTLNGSKPDTDSLKWPGKLTISDNCKLRVAAVKPGWTRNYITESYTFALRNESILYNYKVKYFYNTLSDNDKLVYERLFDAINNFSGDVDLNELNSANIQKICSMIKHENPQFFWFDGVAPSSSAKYRITYKMSSSEAADIKRAIEPKAADIIRKAFLEDNVKGRVRRIHTEVIGAATYKAGSEASCSRIDGAIVTGFANSEGLAEAFMYLCQMAGIDAVRVDGFVGNTAHAWNMVKVNGKWLHVNVGINERRGDDMYYCLDDKKMGADHLTDEKLNYPTTIKYNEKEAKAEFEKFMAEIKQNYSNKKRTTRFYPNTNSFASFIKYTFNHMYKEVGSININAEVYYEYSAKDGWFEITLV